MNASARLIVVSNRLPMTIHSKDDEKTLHPSSGGLISALAPILKNSGGYPSTLHRCCHHVANDNWVRQLIVNDTKQKKRHHRPRRRARTVGKGEGGFLWSTDCRFRRELLTVTPRAEHLRVFPELMWSRVLPVHSISRGCRGWKYSNSRIFATKLGYWARYCSAPIRSMHTL
jgi:hypothetical protein